MQDRHENCLALHFSVHHTLPTFRRRAFSCVFRTPSEGEQGLQTENPKILSEKCFISFITSRNSTYFTYSNIS